MERDESQVKVVYLDMLFAVNAVMDCVLLSLVAFVWHRPRKWRRILLAALFGGVWACLVAINRQLIRPWFAPWFGDCLTWTVISGLMVKVAFQSRGIRMIWYQATLFGMAFVVGGVVDALYYHTRLGASVLTLLCGILLVAIGGLVLWHAWQQTVQKPDIRVVRLVFRGKELTLQALYDTGNRLCDPMSGRPVHVLELTAAKELLTAAEASQLKQFPNITETDLLIRFVPYVSVGQEAGVMPAILMDELWLEGEEPRQLTSPLIGFSFHSLNQQGSYQMILHPIADRQNSEIWEDGRL